MCVANLEWERKSRTWRIVDISTYSLNVLVVITSFFLLLRPPPATLWAPAVLQSMTPTAIKGVVAMFQDYVPLSEGKNTHDHTHRANLSSTIITQRHSQNHRTNTQTHT